ncbi:unnamed protein product [Paramecium pentaurelia]|uniref:Uncharacterized protein n=1 Tax=Paramecium pentaurelia TaxID=43138 RepID=A0A8S1XSX3_9CILI|nr:unnamed protein product [Paramecium pentaurelia]
MNSQLQLNKPYKPQGDVEDVQIRDFSVQFKPQNSICKFKMTQRVDFISTFYTGNIPSLQKTPIRGILKQ